MKRPCFKDSCVLQWYIQSKSVFSEECRNEPFGLCSEGDIGCSSKIVNKCGINVVPLQIQYCILAENESS